MTSKEAIKVLDRITVKNTEQKYNTPYEIGEALNIAIKALEQDTVSKESYDCEYFLRKELETKLEQQESILNKIREEIERKAHSGRWNDATVYGMVMAAAIVDKYKAESEDKE